MKPAQNKGKKEGGVVKRAISLPKSLDKKLLALIAGGGRTYSGTIREAVELYLESLESRDVEDAYARYYSQQEPVRQDRALAREVSDLPWRHWP